MRNLFLTFIALFLTVTQLKAQADSIAKATAKISAVNDSTYSIQVHVQVQAGWKIYDANSEGVEAPGLKYTLETAIPKAKPQYSIASVEQKDPLFNLAKSFSEAFDIREELVIHGFQPDSLKGVVVMSAGKESSFYVIELPIAMPLIHGQKSNQFNILLPETARIAPADACGVNATSTSADSGAWGVFFLGFLGGLIALVTPCVFPMIPVTVSFFTKRSKTRKQGIQNGLLYGLSIFLIYVLASVPFHIVGNVQPEIFNSISTNAWLNIAFFAIFIFFSISFFGYFEISLPSGIANKADSKSGLGSLGGIFFMAITLAIVSFSCTGPILGTLLVGSLQGGAWALTQGMAGFGLALALPFTLFAIFPQWLQSLPKSGGWLDTVKKVLAFVELALAFKFLSNADLVQHWGILKREVFIGIWILISLGLSAYLFGFLLLPHDVKGAKIATGRKIMGGLALGFALYLGAGLMPQNANNLKLLSGFPPPTHYSLFATDSTSHGLKADVVNDYTKALAMAKAQQKPILIDFTGWACVNCRKMEEQVWTDPAVQSFIKENFILLSLYVDDRANLPVAERFVYTTQGGQQKQINTVADLWATFETENFNQSSQPLYVVLSPDQVLQSNPIGYTPDIQEYLAWLQCSAKKK
ncbi:MAG: thioredoxin family protein [Sediminibacterium sp.]|nr:thioredoxin family protein [Sediminibacterium sp.]MBP6144574.1 thioredoxin family protein [Sediminibacterium sp.]